MNKASPQLAVAESGHQTSHPTFREAFRFWLKLGFVSFGGPTGQIAMMHAEVVEKKKWIGETHFLHALNFCMLLPGPEAQQLAIYIGWLLHKTRGGIVAGALFTHSRLQDFRDMDLSLVGADFVRRNFSWSATHNLS